MNLTSDDDCISWIYRKIVCQWHKQRGVTTSAVTLLTATIANVTVMQQSSADERG